MFKCEICYEWCSRITTTQQWWDIAKNDWGSLNGKDLPYYVAILSVLRETTKEMLSEKERTSMNHSKMKMDKRGYSLVSNRNCKFSQLTELQQNKWRGLYQTIRAFRNGSAHISNVKSINPFFLNKIRNPEDSTQDYYRYAPFPDLSTISDNNLRKIHEFVKPAILSDVRSSISTIHSSRIKYELYHVERSPFIDLLHTKMIELLEEVNVW